MLGKLSWSAIPFNEPLPMISVAVRQDRYVADWIAEDIVSGEAMSNAPLPNWVFDGRDGVHGAEGSYSPARDAKLPRSALPVYQRQRFPDPLLGERFAPGETAKTVKVTLTDDAPGTATATSDVGRLPSDFRPSEEAITSLVRAE